MGPKIARGDRSGRPSSLPSSVVRPVRCSLFPRSYAVLTHLQSSASPGRFPYARMPIR
jgi:hypothetical protein